MPVHLSRFGPPKGRLRQVFPYVSIKYGFIPDVSVGFCIDKGQEWSETVENNGLTVNAIFYCMHFFDIYIRTVFGEWCMAAACFLCIQ